MSTAELLPQREAPADEASGALARFLARFQFRDAAQTFTITVGAILVSLVLFAIYMGVRYFVRWDLFRWDGGILSILSQIVDIFPQIYASSIQLYKYMYLGSFGSSISIQNSLLTAAPLILVALCTALPSRVGLIIIGGDGAVAVGGLAAAMVGLQLKGAPLPVVLVGMALAGMMGGALLIALAGMLRHMRGVNETISSLLLSLIAALGLFRFLVEGPLRDPNPITANKPSTTPIADHPILGNMFGYDVHWGLGLGIVFCLLTWLLMYHTTFGFGARMVGGNVRAAQAAGLPVGWLILVTCMLAGAAAGLAGGVEVAAVHLQANDSLFARAGLTIGLMGVLVSFIGRHNPLAVIAAAAMVGGVLESSSMLQRRLRVPDASSQALLGIMMVCIIFSETLYGRFRIFMPREVQKAMASK